jgi:hypothetical protein
MTNGGAVINGVQVQVPGLACASWLDDPVLRLGSGDKRPRITRWVRGVVLHTTKGIPGGTDTRAQVVMPGLGTSTNAGERCGRLWSTDGRAAGAHLVVDRDGSVSCLADLLLDAAYHAEHANEQTIGVEIYQGDQAELYDGQLDAVVLLCDWLTAAFGIQRQVPPVGIRGVFPRAESGGADLVGVYGHRHVSSNRGPGDPGDAVFQKLVAAGYEQFDFDAGADIAAWKGRQAQAGIVSPDGIPGPQTVAALRAAGRPDGLWVVRPAPAAPATT